ncbi:hypothetical protein AMS59_11115 [Lysinibacillus sp. FJAT-14745]|uniref:hypothetical protein n=1 Tax=Lysinibacillus sp. FJAT-14745 TaxID=1704289 RepID=UPI0006AB8282|nr:hypothetical protein [Lysinibacillus sp. FJAT-14745]KOP78412.1 hypothetical protein AMS59_11115 [Lysinibacillus sp. FJAT-14745]
MDIKEAFGIIYDGLISENSVPVKLRTNKELDSILLNQVREALDVLTQYYKDKETVPKKLALAMVDIYGAFSFQAGYFNDKFLEELEGIGIELQEKAMKLFSE